MKLPTTTMFNYENEDVLNRYMNEHHTTMNEAKEAFDELKKFLYACKISPQRCAPSKSIDKVWHEFILHTEDYQDYCDNLGNFIHHDPSDQEEVVAYENTRKLIKELFGSLNETYWPKHKMEAASCTGKCKSGTCGGGGKDKDKETDKDKEKEKPVEKEKES